MGVVVGGWCVDVCGARMRARRAACRFFQSCELCTQDANCALQLLHILQRPLLHTDTHTTLLLAWGHARPSAHTTTTALDAKSVGVVFFAPLPLL